MVRDLKQAGKGKNLGGRDNNIYRIFSVLTFSLFIFGGGVGWGRLNLKRKE